MKSIGWFATAAVVVACVGSDPGGGPADEPAAAAADGNGSGSGGPDAGGDGSTPLGRGIFGSSRFGDGCTYGP